MASSGTYVKGFHNNKYWLEIDWTQTKDTNNNKSTITSKVYIRTEPGWSLYYSARKDGNTTVDSLSTNWYSDVDVSTGGGTRHHVHTVTHTVNHNTDGTKSLSMSTWFDIEVTISGVWYGRISASSGTVTLDKIDRPLMSVYAGGWKKAKGVWVYASGWKQAKGVWVFSGGAWRPAK